MDIEIKKAVKNSKYFSPLFSSTSVAKRVYIQKEFRLAIDTADEIPEEQIFIIPIRIDEYQIPFDKLSSIQYQDMFPQWNKGLQRIIRALSA